ncbi:30S ribosomal protein S9 [Patescibacteria group bacterium]
MVEKTKKPKKEKKPVKAKKKKTRKPSYLFAVGRRKKAIARVRLYTGKKGEMIINDKLFSEYLKDEVSKTLLLEPLRTCNLIDRYLFTVKVLGSGKNSQLGAIIHGMSRAIVKLDEEKYRPILKKRGFLTRDSRMRERRKIGTGGKARRQKQSPKR